MDHHIWCNRLSHDQRPDGSCVFCEQLNREYPPQGTLDYSEVPIFVEEHEDEEA